MIREFRIWWRARPYIKQLKEMKKMKFNSKLQMVLHAATIIAGFLLTVAPLLPAKYKPGVIVVTGAVQMALGKIGAMLNPDGTPATEPYVKEKESE